jgi:hypothetical protein
MFAPDLNNGGLKQVTDRLITNQIRKWPALSFLSQVEPVSLAKRSNTL